MRNQVLSRKQMLLLAHQQQQQPCTHNVCSMRISVLNCWNVPHVALHRTQPPSSVPRRCCCSSGSSRAPSQHAGTSWTTAAVRRPSSRYWVTVGQGWDVIAPWAGAPAMCSATALLKMSEDMTVYAPHAVQAAATIRDAIVREWTALSPEEVGRMPAQEAGALQSYRCMGWYSPTGRRFILECMLDPCKAQLPSSAHAGCRPAGVPGAGSAALRTCRGRRQRQPGAVHPGVCLCAGYQEGLDGAGARGEGGPGQGACMTHVYISVSLGPGWHRWARRQAALESHSCT